MAENRHQIVADTLQSLPESLGFRQYRVSDEHYELQSDRCILRYFFDRFECGAMVEIIEPAKPTDGMSLLLLRHIRHAGKVFDDGNVGTLLTECFYDLLSGDFSIRKQYDEVYDKFFDHILEARSLPDGHPTQVLFDNYDLRWIDGF